LTTANAFDEVPIAAPAYTTARAYPASMSRPATYSAPAPTRTRTVASRQPVSYRTAPSEPVRQGRSWKKSALIIGGSAAGGAGIGAIVGGKGGAIKGAVLGGVAGTVYDIATRNK
jgi:outer membrane lipoprotein SlyB